MKTAIVTLKSVSIYSQGRKIQSPRTERETAPDHELRTWRERLHVDPNGFVFIPPMAFKNCLSETAKFISMQIPGKGKSTYTKHFEAGLLITDPLVLPIKAADVQGEWLFVPTDGRRGSGKRVDKCFPVIQSWEGDVTCYVLDDALTEPVLKYHWEQAGKFIGIGRFRPRNNGYYGRFEVRSIIME
jgi:hypothetical protein